MNCVKCGANLGEGDIFCPKCGTPVQKPAGNENMAQNENMYTYERKEEQPVQTNQNYERPTNNNSGNQNSKKSGNSSDIVKICIAAIIAVAIIIAGIFIFKAVTSSKGDKTSGGNVSSNGGSSSGLNSNNKTNNENVTPVENENLSTYKVNYEGFTFKIPVNLVYEDSYELGQLLISDEMQTWYVGLQTQQGSYQTLKQNRSSMTTSIMQYFNEYLGIEAKVSAPTVEKIGGVEYIILEVSAEGENVLYAYASLNSMTVACMTIQSEDGSFDREPLKEMSKIISNAEYKGDSSYIKSDDKTKGMAKVITKVGEELGK